MILGRNASYGDRGYTQRTPPLSRALLLPEPQLSPIQRPKAARVRSTVLEKTWHLSRALLGARRCSATVASAGRCLGPGGRDPGPAFAGRHLGTSLAGPTPIREVPGVTSDPGPPRTSPCPRGPPFPRPGPT